MNTILPARLEGEHRADISSELPLRVCVLRHCECSYVVALQDVQEISPVDSIARLPGLPPVIKAVSNVRGTVVPIVDLRRILRLPQVEQQAPQLTLVLRYKEYQIGVHVDAVPEILTVRPDQFLPAREHEIETTGIIAGHLQLGEDLNDVLDVRSLVACLEDEAVEADLKEGTNLLGH